MTTSCTRRAGFPGLRLGLAALVPGLLLACWLAGDAVGLAALDPPYTAQGPGARSGKVLARKQEGKTPARKRPRDEEEEEDKDVKPKRKVDRVDDEPGKQPTPVRPAAPPGGDLHRAARQARHFAVQQLFLNLATPHDEVTFRPFERVKPARNPRRENVKPIPLYVGNNPEAVQAVLRLTPLGPDGEPLKPSTASPGTIASVRHYEQLAQDEVRDFLDKHYENFFSGSKRFLSRHDQLVAAEQALSTALRFHESARETGDRRGDGWDDVEKSLREQLLDVQLQQLRGLTEAREWDQAFALTRRLAETYPGAAEQGKIAKPLVGLLQGALKDPTAGADKMKEARQRLRALEDQFPNSEVIKPITASLRAQAQALFDEAKRWAEEGKDQARAQDLLRQAEEACPTLPGLHAYRLALEKEHPVLRVGVRGLLPHYLSPGWACTDTELRCVELLFESLVKLRPDGSGLVRYHPGLAAGRPQVIPLGRQFTLPQGALWSNNQPLNTGDLRFTVRLLKKEGGRGTGRLPGWGDLLEEVDVGGDPFRAKVTLRQGYLDPLSLMTFKVLPQKSEFKPDSEDFAKEPVGSGPFRYAGRKSEQGREYALFLANPQYGSRESKLGLPRIREIRVFACADPAKEFAPLKLHLALGLTAEQAAALRKEQDVTVRMPARTTPNRRVYFLAVNQRQPPLASPELRRALAYAINREKLLDDCFRTGLGRDVHKAINSPYPAGSWPCDPSLRNRADKESLDPYDPDLARALMRQAADKNVRDVTLKLRYPAGDPLVAKALAGLRDQVREGIGVQLELVEEPDPRKLREDVEAGVGYELAYYHYDFPDETWWLWPLLGNGGGRGNFLGYRGEAQNLLQESMSHRHFADVQRYTRAIHRLLLTRDMPLIPLWQLDPLNAVHKALVAGTFDPLLVFPDVDRWMLEAK
jgi:ABC-type transport system substrate-binding protein